MKAEFITSEYVFAHGKAPKGEGSWAFLDRKGVIRWFSGTYSEAKKQAVTAGMTGQILVLS